MRTTVCLWLLLTWSCRLFSQSFGKITGTVTDSQTARPLEGTTVLVLYHAPGLYLNHAVSDSKGSFTVSKIPLNVPVDIILSFMGYRDSTATVMLTSKTIAMNTGIWIIHPVSNDLDSVTVSIHRPPFIVKKDTLEFDATAFKSLPGDMLQNLLRRLPGLVIDQDGNVTVNGKKVTKIKVDGRDFFSSNLHMAIDNLPGAIIEKVQVFGTSNAGTEHNTIIGPITEELTLNIALKKQNRHGVFGSAAAGAGAATRYSLNGFVNQFKDVNRLSVYANSGNVQLSTGPFVPLGGSGILDWAIAGGLNWNTLLNTGQHLDIGYLSNTSRGLTASTLQRTNLLPDKSFNYNSQTQLQENNGAHHLSLEYVNDIDSFQQLSVSTSGGYTQNVTDATTQSTSLITTGEPIIVQHLRNQNTDQSFALNNRINYNRNSRDHKVNFSASWSLDLRNAHSSSLNRAQTTVNNASTPLVRSSDQSGNSTGSGAGNALSMNFSCRLNRHFTAILHYSFIQTPDKTNRDVYNFNTISGKYDLPDSLYSGHSRNRAAMQIPTAKLGYTAKNLLVEIGVGYRWISQESGTFQKKSFVKINQKNFNPQLSTSFRLSKHTVWISNYTIEALSPVPAQLAPVASNTNPLVVRIGNPMLRSSLAHNITTELQYFDSDYKWRINLRGNISMTGGAITTDTYYDSSDRQITTYRNTNGNNQVQMSVNAGTFLTINGWAMHAEVMTTLSATNSKGFINRQVNTSITKQIRPQLTAGISFKQIILFDINAGIDLNFTSYSLASIDQIQYNLQHAGINCKLILLKRLILSSSTYYSYNSQLSKGFQQSVILINAAANYRFLKSEKLSVGISVNDLMNNNTNLNRTVSPTAIETTQYNALKRSALFNVNYRFSQFHTAG